LKVERVSVNYRVNSLCGDVKVVKLIG